MTTKFLSDAQFEGMASRLLGALRVPLREVGRCSGAVERIPRNVLATEH